MEMNTEAGKTGSVEGRVQESLSWPRRGSFHGPVQSLGSMAEGWD